jgi:hypothetical protein
MPRPLAQPVPAPPSRNPLAPPRTQEPPLGAPSTPNVRESRRVPNVADAQPFYNAYPLALGNDPAPATGRCRVSVWNLTGQPVSLKIGDQQQVVPRNEQSRPLEVDRQFIWRVDDREPQNERVPAGEAGLVIVLRR